MLLITCYYMWLGALVIDSFQDTYCRVLVRYKEELSRPLDEAASFLSSIQAQLSNLCSGGSSPAATATHSGNEINHRTHTYRHLV